MSRWRRILAVGCSHGVYADPVALDAVVQFKQQFKPHTVIHLGDAIDMTAFRSGAAGTADESEAILPDVDAGLEFLRRLQPNHFTLGNHEDRVYRLMSHPNAIVRLCASDVAGRIEAMARHLKCSIHPWTPELNWVTLGGYKFGHGFFYSENYLRDSAEAFGPCVVAHAHRAGSATGRRLDTPRAYGVGTLSRREAMTYAKARRATLAWSAGFVWGEYCENAAQLWLHDNGQSREWRLPT